VESGRLRRDKWETSWCRRLAGRATRAYSAWVFKLQACDAVSVMVYYWQWKLAVDTMMTLAPGGCALGVFAALSAWLSSGPGHMPGRCITRICEVWLGLHVKLAHMYAFTLAAGEAHELRAHRCEGCRSNGIVCSEHIEQARRCSSLQCRNK
jgi:hypothetical protein